MTATRLGMLTPSSNTVLEPLTARMLAALPSVTAHFSRFRVTEIGLSEAALGQFDSAPMAAASDLLADAKVASIVWNGTSAAWLGFPADEALAAAVTARTGIPASTCVLAYRDLFRARGLARIGLVTPYTADVQAKILANWAAAGFDASAERHLGLSENFAFAAVGRAEIARMTHEVAAERVEAIAILCTNLDGAGLVEGLERELGIPVFDSVAVSLWKSLDLAGIDPASLAEWGDLFASGGLRDAGRAPRRAVPAVPARFLSPPGQQESGA